MIIISISLIQEWTEFIERQFAEDAVKCISREYIVSIVTYDLHDGIHFPVCSQVKDMLHAIGNQFVLFATSHGFLHQVNLHFLAISREKSLSFGLATRSIQEHQFFFRQGKRQFKFAVFHWIIINKLHLWITNQIHLRSIKGRMSFHFQCHWTSRIEHHRLECHRFRDMSCSYRTIIYVSLFGNAIRWLIDLTLFIKCIASISQQSFQPIIICLFYQWLDEI